MGLLFPPPAFDIPSRHRHNAIQTPILASSRSFLPLPLMMKMMKDCSPLIQVVFCPIPQEFTSYLQKHDEVLTELEKATKRLKKLEMVYKEFELQKVCYLPLNTFLLKPIQRLMHYKLILGRLCKHYTAEHRDFADCRSE